MRRGSWLLGGVLVLSACSASRSSDSPAPATLPTDVTVLTQPSPSPLPNPAPTGEPVTTEADCPYLDTALVQETVGQQTPTVTTTTTPNGPPPACTFTKPDGEPAVTVEVTVAADPVAARTAAVERVAPLGGTAVDDIADGGGIAVAPDGTTLAVADGTLVVVVTINQRSSLQAREIAAAVTAAL